jgi:hypothetical protein
VVSYTVILISALARLRLGHMVLESNGFGVRE